MWNKSYLFYILKSKAVYKVLCNTFIIFKLLNSYILEAKLSCPSLFFKKALKISKNVNNLENSRKNGNEDKINEIFSRLQYSKIKN